MILLVFGSIQALIRMMRQRKYTEVLEQAQATQAVGVWGLVSLML